MLIPKFNKYPKPTDWNSLYILAQQAFEDGFRAFTIEDLKAFLDTGGTGLPPNIAPFKVRLGDDQVTIEGDDTVIGDSRLLGLVDYPVNCTQLNNATFRDDELAYNGTTGTVRLLNFTLQAGEVVTIFPAVGTSGSGNPMQPILDRITNLERMVAPLLTGGRVLYSGPINEIPPGWEIDTEGAGRVPVGFDPSDPDFNSMGTKSGAKTVTLSKANLPDIILRIDIPPNQTSIGHKNGGKFVTGGEEAAPGGLPAIYTESLGSGTPLSTMNPYWVVCWIKYVGV